MTNERHPIFVYCDSEKHPNKCVAVANFNPSDDGSWAFVGENRGNLAGGVLDGRSPHLVLGDDMVFRTTRDRFVCRKCKKPVVVTLPKLYAVLNAFATRGLTRVPLSLLAASIGYVGSDPGPDQRQG